MNRMQKAILVVLLSATGFSSALTGSVETRPPKPHQDITEEADDTIRPMRLTLASDNPR